jgi:hypothetical protein
VGVRSRASAMGREVVIGPRGGVGPKLCRVGIAQRAQQPDRRAVRSGWRVSEAFSG